jgi:hypothetical protein
MAKPKKFVVGGLLNLGYGLGTAAFSYAQKQKSLRELAQLDQAEQGNIMSMAARNRVARQESDAQSALDAAGRATATQLSAAQEAGGSRAIQSISPQVSRASEEANARALQQFGNVGAQLSNQEDANMLTASQGRIGEQRDALRRSADMATQNVTQGIGLAAAGVAETAGGLAVLGAEGDENTGSNGSSSNSLGSAPKSGADFLKLSKGLSGDITKAFAPKAKISFGRKGKNGMVVKTPGSFSHKSNPIDVIKDGKKIAEMTGGEYIFNPKQSQKLRNLSEDGTSTLHKFVRELLSKSQFK